MNIVITREMEHINIQYRITGFDLTQFVPSWEGIGECSDFEMNNGVDFSYNHEHHTIKCTHNIDFSNKGKTVLKIQLCTFVSLTEESAHALSHDGKITIPAGFLAQCASFGHGALRGIMLLKTSNTPLEGVILPPVVYGDVFKKSISFDL